MSLVIKNLFKEYGTYPALNGINLSVPEGAFVALLGPSGSGKTTLLRILGGLEIPVCGSVHFGDIDLLTVPARQRHTGFVFQNYALFRHMTVAANIAFGLKIRPRRERPTRQEISRRVEELLELVQLEGLGERYPSQLSGGQRQRVALARALAIEPRLLLLDEPFGALDAKVRKELRIWLKQLHARLGLTTVFVTHDQDEAFSMADKIAVMNKGIIEQFATQEDLCNAPQSDFVRTFLDLPSQEERTQSQDPKAVPAFRPPEND